MKYRFIAEQATEYPVRVLCRVMGAKKNAYYAWRAQGAKVIAAEELVQRRHMKALFAESR